MSLSRDPSPPEGSAADWRSILGSARDDADTALALGVELRVRDGRGANPWASRPQRTATARDVAKRTGEILLGIRPLERSASTGAWVQGAATWDAVRRSPRSTGAIARGGSLTCSASLATRCCRARPVIGWSPIDRVRALLGASARRRGGRHPPRRHAEEHHCRARRRCRDPGDGRARRRGRDRRASRHHDRWSRCRALRRPDDRPQRRVRDRATGEQHPGDPRRGADQRARPCPSRRQDRAGGAA